MNSQQLDQQIRERISTFLEQLSTLVRQSALEAVREALSGGAVPAPARRGPGRPPKAAAAAAPAAAAPKAARKTGKRGKRSSEDVTELAAQVYDYISKNAGQSIEEIGRGMGKPTKVLKLPIKKLIEAKKLKTTGQRRGTRYNAK
ncbi:MAG: DNA-binding protein [Planctomycetota bacterium]|nr:DNA-binding protein [Planctomycetota bacterium]